MPQNAEEAENNPGMPAIGFRACPTLLQETLGEESLKEAREIGMGGHGLTSLLCSSLWVANSSNSGMASMYQ